MELVQRLYLPSKPGRQEPTLDLSALNQGILIRYKHILSTDLRFSVILQFPRLYNVVSCTGCPLQIMRLIKKVETTLHGMISF